MKICLASLHPRMLSGQIRELVGLGQALERLGHDVRMVSAFSTHDLMDDHQRGAATDRARLPTLLLRMGRTVRAVMEAAREADLLHLNLPTPAFGMLADVMQARLGVPMVVGFEAHLPSTADLLRQLPRSPSFYLPRLLVNTSLIARACRHRCARYIVSSHFQAAELTSLGIPEERIAVIPGIHDAHGCRLSGTDTSVREALRLPEGDLVTYVGHFNPIKGVDVLVSAFPLVLRARPEARLVLAWSGLGPERPIRAAIERTGIGEKTVHLGHVGVADLLAASDVVALPYRLSTGQAAFPAVVLESMSVGVPLVTTDLPLLREIVQPGQTGLMVRPEDPLALAEAIIHLLRHPEQARAMAQHQRVQMATRFHPEQLARRYEYVYAQTFQWAHGQAAFLQSS